MQRSLFILLTIISIHLLASISMAGNGTESLPGVSQVIGRTENHNQNENNMDLLRKRVDELEKRVEKLEEKSKPGVKPVSSNSEIKAHILDFKKKIKDFWDKNV
ncbi:MAG TPA: hypothetical protein VHP36_09540 [Chitinispirillaceae bacterium]|nr:hypothetical protein [Chitinispirillaceae bacterium]